MNLIPFNVWKAIGKATMNLKAARMTVGRFNPWTKLTKVVKSIGRVANPTPPMRRARNKAYLTKL